MDGMGIIWDHDSNPLEHVFSPKFSDTPISFHSFALCNLLSGDAQNQRVNRFDREDCEQNEICSGFITAGCFCDPFGLEFPMLETFQTHARCFQVQDAGAGNLEKGHLLCVNCVHFISFRFTSFRFISVS